MLGVILAFIGKSRLLATKKFKQFEGKHRRSLLDFVSRSSTDCVISGLCEENLVPKADGPATLSGDLQGFWDMMMLQVDNINDSFIEIQKCRANGWQVSST